MMNQKKLKVAVDEAKRFLKRAKDMHVHEDNFGGYHSGKESGALRRASMDLTRALADLRRGRE